MDIAGIVLIVAVIGVVLYLVNKNDDGHKKQSGVGGGQPKDPNPRSKD
jgi:hypothetical protein